MTDKLPNIELIFDKNLFIHQMLTDKMTGTIIKKSIISCKLNRKSMLDIEIVIKETYKN